MQRVDPSPRSAPRPRPSGSATRRPDGRKDAVRAAFETLEERRLLSFGSPVAYAVGGYPQGVLTADFNNDNVPDLAVANSSSSTVSALLGNGDGTFQTAKNSATGVHPRSLAVGDFDGDGKSDDIATVNDGDVSVLLGNGDGTFALKQTLNLPAVAVPDNVGDLPQNPLSVAVGDLTGDGLLDLAVTGHTSFVTKNGPYTYTDYWGNQTTYYNYQTHDNGHVNVLVGDGAGKFTAPTAAGVQLLQGSYPISAVLKQLDGQPGLDLAIANLYSSNVQVLSGNNAGGFGAPVDHSTGWNPNSVLTGDVNGDGITDLVTANYNYASVLLGNGSAGVGDGTFQTAQNTALGAYPASVAVGDINADGKLDLVTSSNLYTQTGYYTGFETGQVNVLLGYGDGSFATPTTQALADGTYASGVALGKFNADGLPDVAVANSDAISGHATVLVNAGGWILPAKLTVSDVTVTEGNAGTVGAVFTVTRGGNLDTTVTVNYSTADGGALAGSDYVAQLNKTLTFAPGEATKTVTILVNGDVTDEYDQDFYVNLSSPTNAEIRDSQGVGTILDDDAAPSIVISDVSKAEGDHGSTAFVFTVSLSAASEKYISLNFSTANGTAATADNDYNAASGSLSFAPGQRTQTITVFVVGDKRKESSETFFVNLSGAANALITDGQGVGTILDDDTPPHGGGKK